MLDDVPVMVPWHLPRASELFDLVIIDEVISKFPQNALGAIIRGKNCDCCDTNQLPPSDFFKKHQRRRRCEDDVVVKSPF